jgi:hypothetical protein
MRIKVLRPDPALAEDGLSVGDEADMAPMRALPLIAAGVVDLADEPKETRIVRGYERKGTA